MIIGYDCVSINQLATINVMDTISDKKIHELFGSWSLTTDPGFYTFTQIAQAIGEQPSKAVSHAIGRAADKHCFPRSAGNGGRGIRIVSAPPAATAASGEILEHMRLQQERIDMLARQFSALKAEFQSFRENSNSHEDRVKAGLAKLSKTHREMYDYYRPKWHGTMSREAVMGLSGALRPGYEHLEKQIDELLSMGEGWLCRKEVSEFGVTFEFL